MCPYLLHVNNLLSIIDVPRLLSNPFPANMRRGKPGGCRVAQVNKDEKSAAV
jgi:hypothetical protein